MRDNWAVCPECVENEVHRQRNLRVDLRLSYGKVSLNEYMQKYNEVQSLKAPNDIPETLGEDYTIGIDYEGMFYAVYKGMCTSCGFSFTYDYKEGVGGKWKPVKAERS